MNIQIKISKKPVEYTKAITILEKRLDRLKNHKANELVWILEHPKVYTGGTNYKNYEIKTRLLEKYFICILFYYYRTYIIVF